MELFRRLFGICVTSLPSDTDCWQIQGGKIEIDLSKASELTLKGGALRLEGQGLEPRMLVIHGVDGKFYAYQNNCACSGWRLDPVEGEEKIRCYTLAQSTFDYSGHPVSGPAEKDLKVYPVEVGEDDRTLRIDVSS